ncbi:uncharacterized protein [Zea mays]|uniref:uncharacterized protein n=1 Tax=Zea mays TaxID=4577 RepID=UPI0016532846|nr:uncharacterized protein LOC118472952 [Zea mays]
MANRTSCLVAAPRNHYHSLSLSHLLSLMLATATTPITWWLPIPAPKSKAPRRAPRRPAWLSRRDLFFSGESFDQFVIRFRASRDRRSSFGDQVIKLLELYEIEDSEHLFGEGCLWCNLCSGKEEGVEVDLQEFQDVDEFED